MIRSPLEKDRLWLNVHPLRTMTTNNGFSQIVWLSCACESACHPGRIRERLVATDLFNDVKRRVQLTTIPSNLVTKSNCIGSSDLTSAAVRRCIAQNSASVTRLHDGHGVGAGVCSAGAAWGSEMSLLLPQPASIMSATGAGLTSASPPAHASPAFSVRRHRRLARTSSRDGRGTLLHRAGCLSTTIGTLVGGAGQDGGPDSTRQSYMAPGDPSKPPIREQSRRFPLYPRYPHRALRNSILLGSARRRSAPISNWPNVRNCRLQTAP
jgi:hypothetical protein